MSCSTTIECVELAMKLFPKGTWTEEQQDFWAQHLEGHDPGAVESAIRDHKLARGAYHEPVLKDVVGRLPRREDVPARRGPARPADLLRTVTAKTYVQRFPTWQGQPEPFVLLAAYRAQWIRRSVPIFDTAQKMNRVLTDQEKARIETYERVLARECEMELVSAGMEPEHAAYWAKGVVLCEAEWKAHVEYLRSPFNEHTNNQAEAVATAW